MANKITEQHQLQLNALLAALVEKHGAERIKAEIDFHAQSPIRARWNLLYAIPFSDRKDLIDEIYKYANDDHIDTVLRQWVANFLQSL